MQILQVWGPFLGQLLTAAAATLPQIWLLSAKCNFSLANHTFASLLTVPTASTVGSKAPALSKAQPYGLQHPTGSPPRTAVISPLPAQPDLSNSIPKAGDDYACSHLLETYVQR